MREKPQKKVVKKSLSNDLKKLQIKGNELFKTREDLIVELNETREILQDNLIQQHDLEEQIKNG